MAAEIMAAEIKLKGLPRKLVIDGLIEEEIAIEALQASLKEKVSFTNYLVTNNLLSATKIAMEASKEFGLPVFDLDAIDSESIPQNIVDDKLIKKHHALPLFKRGNRLYVGIADPTNLAAIDDIKFQTGVNTEAILVEEDKLSRMVEKLLEEQEAAMDQMMGDDLEDLDDLDFSDPDAEQKEDDSGSDVDDTPVVRFINKILLDAIKKAHPISILNPTKKSIAYDCV
jgi:type IV pilus assembly protein PilB